MNISSLISIIGANNSEFLFDYYGQVKSGITDSNSKIWKFLILCAVIAVCYFFLNEKLIDSFQLSLISFKNPKIVSIVTPPLFTLSYLLYSLHANRYRTLVDHYNLLTDYLCGFKNGEKASDYINHVLPINLTDSIINLFFSVNSVSMAIVNFLLAIPFLAIQILAFTFIYYTVSQIWDFTGVFFFLAKYLSIWMAVVVLIISGISENNRRKDRELIAEFQVGEINNKNV